MGISVSMNNSAFILPLKIVVQNYSSVMLTYILAVIGLYFNGGFTDTFVYSISLMEIKVAVCL